MSDGSITIAGISIDQSDIYGVRDAYQYARDVDAQLALLKGGDPATRLLMAMSNACGITTTQCSDMLIFELREAVAARAAYLQGCDEECFRAQTQAGQFLFAAGASAISEHF